jgi:hypothetical protein
MKDIHIYHIGSERIALIDGQIFLLLQPAVPDIPTSAPTLQDKTTTRKPRTRRRRIDSTTTDPIKQDIRDGLAPAVISVKHNISVQTVYNLKLRMKKDGELVLKPLPTRLDPTISKTKNYQCMAGHRFSSNLVQNEAKCPRCGAKVFREVKEQDVLETDIN